MYHAMACLTVPKLLYLGEHSEVSQAWSLHACRTRMLYHVFMANIAFLIRSHNMSSLIYVFLHGSLIVFIFDPTIIKSLKFAC